MTLSPNRQFSTRALALTNNLLFGCECIQLADRALMHVDTHNMYEVWVVMSTPQSRTMSVPLDIEDEV